jgi:hypothetical protein
MILRTDKQYLLEEQYNRGRPRQGICRSLSRVGCGGLCGDGGQESMSEMMELMRDFDAAIEYQVGYAQAGFTLENGEEQLARYFPVV